MKNLPRFFWRDFPLTENSAILPDSLENHAARVLRLKIGDFLTLFNGENCERAAQISKISKKNVEIILGESRAISRESPVKITLCQPILSADKMDFVIQKSTELGVFAIAPIFCARGVLKLSGERLAARQNHWQSVAIAACEQCGRNKIPQILPALDFKNLPKNSTAAQIIFLPNAEKTLRDFAPAQEFQILTGAEGGFDDSEIESALQKGFSPCRLGTRILRAETAPLAALSILNFLSGEF